MTSIEYEYSLQVSPDPLSSSSQSTNSINFSFILISRDCIHSSPEAAIDGYIYLPEKRCSEIEFNVQVNRGSLHSDDIANINQLLQGRGIPTETIEDVVKEICDTTEFGRCSIRVVVKKVTTRLRNRDESLLIRRIVDEDILDDSSRADEAIESMDKVKLDGDSAQKFEECRISRQDFRWL